MPFNISIQHDLKKFTQQLSALEKQAYQPAVVSTLNRTAESAKVASARYVAAQLGSKQAGVKRRIETIRATPRRLWATLKAHGRPLQLIEFVVGSKKPTQQLGGKRGLVKTRYKPSIFWRVFYCLEYGGDMHIELFPPEFDFPRKIFSKSDDMLFSMSTKSHIEWTEFTWNPASGCTKISPGCKHCYAEIIAERLQSMKAPGYENGFKLTLHPDRLTQPMQRKKPTTYFVNSIAAAGFYIISLRLDTSIIIINFNN